eukprot:11205923-Lingulodinium_polyedra.AAC.1
MFWRSSASASVRRSRAQDWSRLPRLAGPRPVSAARRAARRRAWGARHCPAAAEGRALSGTGPR